MQAGWTWSPNRRGSLDIIWSCLFTVFISCWTAIHPNIPPPNSQRWHRFLDRIIYLLLAALGPELILAVAIRDYLDAKACAKRLRPDFGDGSKGWSIVHGFYICMGGFHVRYRKGHNAEVTDGWLSAVDVEDHVKRGMLKLEEAISQEEIMDKGKADWLVKCMLGFQVLWLSTQCVARAIQHLPITPLEISTLACVPFVLLALWFWWDKPYNIDVPTLIDGQPRLRGAPLLTAYLAKQNIPEFQPSPYRPFALARECLTVIESGLMHAPDPVRGVAIGLLISSVGGLHCTAWNFPFPTLVEQWAWRVSSVVIGALVPLAWFLSSLYWLLYRFLMESSGRRASDERVYRHTYSHGKSLELEYSHHSALALKAILTTVPCVYILARLCLLAQAFASLRALPEGCYQTIEWSHFVPHNL